MGFTLNEYSPRQSRRQEAGRAQNGRRNLLQAQARLTFLPNCAKIWEKLKPPPHTRCPNLIELSDIRGDVHMHTVETDGRNTIEEMAEAARERGYEYMAITDHSKNLAFANGLTDERALAHIEKIRAVEKKIKGIRIFAGIEVDILPDGSLDLSDSVLEQMDIVIASVHSQFNQDRAAMTDRLLKAIANPNTSLIGHPTGRSAPAPRRLPIRSRRGS